jgi:hypothetical protein
MKKLIYTTLLLATLPFASQAQEQSQELTPAEIGVDSLYKPIIFSKVKGNSNQMSIRVAGYDILLEKDSIDTDLKFKKRASPRYAGRIGFLEVGFNNFKTSGDAYSIYPENEKGFMDLKVERSVHLAFNLTTFSASTRNNVLGVTMGLGITADNYVFETPSRYQKINNVIHPLVRETNLTKSKLTTIALHLPVALEINLSKHLFISMGAYADLGLVSYFKSKRPIEKIYSPGTNFLQAGVTARIGYYDVFYLFANYGLLELFKEGRGPAVTPYNFGLGFFF